MLGTIGHGCDMFASKPRVADNDIRGHLSSGQPFLGLLTQLLSLLTRHDPRGRVIRSRRLRGAKGEGRGQSLGTGAKVRLTDPF